MTLRRAGPVLVLCAAASALAFSRAEHAGARLERFLRSRLGLDPLIVSETLAEAAACRRRGIMVNTFMLARDHDLMSFVRKVAEICHGKAYFTTPYTLGRYVLMDYLSKKTRTIH